MLAALSSAAYVLLSVTGLRLGVAWGWAFAEVAVVVIFVAWMLRRAGHSSIGTGLETVALAYLFSVAGLVIQGPLMALPLPFTDALLSRMDHALGFDWWTFTQLFSDRWLWGAMFVAYASIIPQTFVLLMLLSATARHDRAWQFMTASALALSATMIVMPFFPADGSLALCGLKPGSPWLAKGVCDYGPIIHQLKEGQIKVLAGNALIGMVSLPSFHTAIALQFVWGFWRYRWLRWPAVAFNSLLICGTIAIASHYFVDIVGGALIGLLAIYVARKISARGAAEFYDGAVVLK
jgi:membrane-associated phospholipid phosphatase